MDYASSLFGHGSEVLGYDDHISQDHDWGPRLLIFLKEERFEEVSKTLDDIFRRKLPPRFLDFHTNWSEPDSEDNGTQQLAESKSGIINHRIKFYTIKSYMMKEFGFTKYPLKTLDWLTIPQKKLLELTAGEVFFDNFKELTELRKYFSFYPEQIRIFCLLGEWGEISQMIAFTGRTGFVGDDLGSRLIVNDQIMRIMRLAFLLERKYAPYAKWFGTAFSKLSIADKFLPKFKDILQTDDWNIREKTLANAYKVLANEHIEQNLIPEVEIITKLYHTRPQIVINTASIIQPLREKLSDEFKTIPHIGSINQFIENTYILEYIDTYSKLVSFENF